jgi:hypothetical protein
MTYRIDVLTAARIGARVVRSEVTAVDGITSASEAERTRARIAAERPDALVVVTGYSPRR